MQNHKVKIVIPYAALEPLGKMFFDAGEIEIAGILVLFDAQIAAIYDRQAPDYGVLAYVDTASHEMTANVCAMNKM